METKLCEKPRRTGIFEVPGVGLEPTRGIGCAILRAEGRGEWFEVDQEDLAVPEIYVGIESEFEEERRKIIVVGDVEIGVFRINGQYHAIHNVCVHQGGPVCQGEIIHKVEEILGQDRTSQGLRFSEDQVHIVCPWHGFEYNIKTGIHAGYSKMRLKKFKTQVREGKVYVVV